jgi:hypothetical protein
MAPKQPKAKQKSGQINQIYKPISNEEARQQAVRQAQEHNPGA